MHDLKVAELIAALNRLEAVAPGAANRNPRSALAGASRFLKEYSSLSLQQAEAKLKLAKSSARPKKAASPLRSDAIRRHRERLLAATTDLARFDEAMNYLISDKDVRVEELKAIAKDYGVTFTGRAKRDGYAAIRQKFDERWKLANRSILRAS